MLDLRGVLCPGPLVEAKHVLNGMRPGETLKLVSNCPGIAGDIGGWIKATGNKLLEVDEHGFDEVDRRLLRTIIDKFNGGPVGVNTLAAAISEDKDAIEDIYEPFLMQIGFLDRTPRGRVATARAYEYFGLDAPGKDSRLW